MSEQPQQPAPLDPDTLDRLADIAHELDALSGSGKEVDVLFRRERLYRRAAVLAPSEPTELSDFIKRYLINDCLNMADGAQADKRPLHRLRLRDILADWLDALPENTLWQVRSELVPHVVEKALATPSADALYLLTSMGYRDKRIVGALRHVAGSSGELADTAVRLMVGMRIDRDDLAWVRERIQSRVADASISDELQWAIAILADDSALPQLYKAGLRKEQTWFIFSILGWLCDRAPGDLEWQGRVWETMVALADGREDGWAELLVAGGAIERCHTPRVVEALVAQFPEIVRSGRAHFEHLASRVEDLVSPMQIVGIARVDARAAVAALHQLAVIPTGPTVAAMTAEAYSKEHAWHVALTLGILDVKEWVAEAIDNEPNTYQQHNFMNIAAVLSVPSLPSRVVSLLSSKELMFTRAGHNKELFPFLGASRLAASSLTRDSLRLLLGAEGLMDGHPFVASVDHAAELATWLVKTGDTDLLNELEDAFRSRRPMTCDVAIRTVRILFAGGSSTCISDTILEMLEYNSLDDLYPAYVRADAISARAAAGNLSASFSAALADICKNENEELRVAAAYVLIRAGMLDRYREALHGCAFHSSGGQITVEPSERLTTSEAYLVGWLAATEPAVYARSAARIIEVAFTLAASETIRAIRTAKRTGVKPPDLVCAAIVRCIRDHESPGFANTHLFGELAELDAERLLNEPWERIWQEWMADSRRALADALPEAIRQSADGSSRERAIAIAKALLTDGVFAVRRSAARALGELDQGALRAVCEEYLSSGSIVLRERTAEAAGWLPIDDENTLDNAILRRLGGDSEDRVRDAAKRTREEARRRCWAAEHLRVVLGADSDPNLWVLRKYASGAALAKIGDDRDMLALATHARGSDVPPNVRHWYGRVLKDLDRQWRETTRKWPDPWRPWRGSIEKLGGSLVVKERTYPAQFSLWLVPPQHDLGLTSWGGAADLDKGDAWSLLREYSDSENSRGIVRIEGRAEARALMVRVSGSEVLLSGSGPYPAGVANL